MLALTIGMFSDFMPQFSILSITVNLYKLYRNEHYMQIIGVLENASLFL